MTPADNGAQAMADLEAEAQRVIASLAQKAATVSVLVTLHPVLPPLVVLTPVPRQGRRSAPRGSSTSVRPETHPDRRDAALPLPGHRQPAEQQDFPQPVPALTGRWGGTGRW
ncbi:hypothetical protein [Streptomyces uncialis]|nr:hypothetical protein [Streptomyces uncialis]MCX4657937.1 hypothetical protein [Streptomyces uncialis]